MKEYYIYAYKDPRNNEIKYIGKGKGDRMYTHWKRRHFHWNQLFKEFLIDLESLSLEPIIEIMQSNLTNSEAYINEFIEIKRYGRILYDDDGILFNISTGFESFNIPEGINIVEYLDKRPHFNYKELKEDEINEICTMYLDGNGLVSIAQELSMGPGKIKEALLKRGIELRKRGGQDGSNNGMYGVKRENNAFFTGKKHSKDSCEKISKTLKSLDKGKHIKINGVEFNSIKEASEHLGIPASTIGRYIDKTIIRDNVSYKIEKTISQ